MTGILLFIVIGLWLWVCILVTRPLFPSSQIRPWRGLAGAAVFIVLLVLPVSDEIVGGFQFRALCEKNAVFHLTAQKLEGRMTKFSANPANQIVSGTAIPIYDSGIEYTDTQSGEVVLKFHSYVAKGGILIRTLGISESNSPITMGLHTCSPEISREETASKTFKFSVVN
jgi:NhaP-type Na+/H+ and K+/H+ antiporter